MKLKLADMKSDKKLEEDVKNLNIQVALLTEHIRLKILNEYNPKVEQVVLNSDYSYQIKEDQTIVTIK